MKKFLFSLLLLAFIMPAVKADFSDVHGTSSTEAILYLQESGTVQGFSDGTFKPENNVTRAEFLKIVLLANDPISKNIEKCYEEYLTPECDNCMIPNISSDCSEFVNQLSGGCKTSFSDVSSSDWFYPYVCYSVNNAIVQGYSDRTFRPNDPIIFRDGSKIISEINDIEIPENAGEEWFSGYLAAIERERVYPGSIDDSAQNLSRGEMSEIIWGITTGHEVESDRYGVLPEVESCEELSAQIAKFEKRNRGDWRYQGMRTGGIMEDDMVFEEAMPMEMAEGEAVTSAPAMESDKAISVADDGAGASNTVATEYSTTNIQEFGVDEADIIKNDGSHIFMIKGNTIRIVKAYPADDLEQVAILTTSEGKAFSPREMYLDGDRLIVIGTTWGGRSYDKEPIEFNEEIAVDSIMPPNFGGSATQVIVFDVSDRTTPERIRSVGFEGNYVSSRKIGDTVYPVINVTRNFYGVPRPITAKSIMPKFSDSMRSEEEYISDCTGVRYFPNFSDSNFLILAAIDTSELSTKVDREVVLGGGQEIYASPENMYITRSIWEEYFVDDEDFFGWKNDNKTEIYKYALSEADVEFKAKGEVPGRVLNQFSMSEYSDHFRIATQVGGSWRSNGYNQVTILDTNLKETGKVINIAPGENIKSARFMGEKGYLVTFKNVDPLFVIDLDPQNPKVLGELKIPGWSDYLHPYDENHLIGFGREVDPAAEERGRLTTSDLMGLKLSLFDVSDVENPKEVFKEVIGDRGTYSEILNNHKALLFDKSKGMLGFPIHVTENTDDMYNQKTIFNGAYIYDIDPVNGFSLRGKASHYESDDWYETDDYFQSDWERNIQRIIYIGENFYSISPNYVKAWSWDDVDLINGIQLDEKQCHEIYNEFGCSQHSHCQPVFQTYGECVGTGEDRVCEDNERFIRCETK